jgi:hypothetical protein
MVQPAQAVLEVQHHLPLNICGLRGNDALIADGGAAPMIPETPFLSAQSVHYAAANCYLTGK